MKFTPISRKVDGWVMCSPGAHEISAGEQRVCEECGKPGLTDENSTHINDRTSNAPLICRACGDRYKELYEAGFFALEKMVP